MPAVTLHRALLTAFDQRQVADYRLGSGPSKEDAEHRVAQAEEFVSQVGGLVSDK